MSSMQVTTPSEMGYRGRELNPGSIDCVMFSVAAVALLTIAILGLTGTVNSTVVSSCFLGLTLLPPAIALTRSKNPGAWSIYMTCMIPLFAGIGGAALTGAIPMVPLSTLSITAASLQLCSLSSFASKKL